jgi:hypothetical protein
MPMFAAFHYYGKRFNFARKNPAGIPSSRAVVAFDIMVVLLRLAVIAPHPCSSQPRPNH